ncbi:hypothetical protein [Treponema pedis]|uniref:hypothetical protein n=2 Tax=Treponema pedis TaxID=409322 RepID=UPI0004143CE7|nr:hypothetical protein [Treponema pedis]
MAKREKITTVKINPYEIAKASDMDTGFQSFLENAALITSLVVSAERDFVIGGAIIPGAGLNVLVKPFIAFCKDTGQLYCKATDTIVEFYKASAVHDRIDVITVSGEGWDVFQKERRAKWYVTKNPDTGVNNDSLVFDEFEKRQAQNVELEALQGQENSGTAKNAGIGQVKIAEVYIKASRDLLDEEDIRYVEAPIDGAQNKKWTAEKSRTFYIAPVTIAAQRFFKIHKTDGSLKEGVVGKNNLALSSGDIITSNDIAIGQAIVKKAEKFNNHTGENEPIKPVVGNYKLEFNIFESTKIKNVFDIVVDGLIYIWKVFIESDKAIVKDGKVYTNEQVQKLDDEFTKKLDSETEERKQADEAEKTARKEAIEREVTERKAADEAEKTAREQAIEKETTERKTADETEKAAREEGDKRNEQLLHNALRLSVPVGSLACMYDGEKHKTFLKLDGSSFEPAQYPEFYEYWQKHLAFLGTDSSGKPFLPTVETEDYSRLGEMVTFIGEEYHHEFLICNGLPFSPDVYQEFYEAYWKRYFSHLGNDSVTGWPLRPKLESTIENANVYIKVLPNKKNEFVTPFIKTGEEI